jgi:hypothetical protein
VAGKRLRRCEREYCKGSILTWDGMARCHLCGRSPGGAPSPPPPPPRRGSRRRLDPYIEMAEQALPPPERSAVWDESLGAYVIDEMGEG